MKRIDLQVGQTYLCTPTKDWEDYKATPHMRATVLSADLWESHRGFGASAASRNVEVTLPDGRIITGDVFGARSEKGNRVLVQIGEPGFERLELVPLSYVKALWEDGVAVTKARAFQRMQRAEEKRLAADAYRQHLEALQARVSEAVGQDVQLRPAPYGVTGDVVISMEVLEALLSR